MLLLLNCTIQDYPSLVKFCFIFHTEYIYSGKICKGSHEAMSCFIFEHELIETRYRWAALISQMFAFSSYTWLTVETFLSVISRKVL